MPVLDAGTNVNARDEDGDTPLSLACLRGLANVAQALLANGADIESRDRHGFTPLIRASMAGHQQDEL